MFRAMTYQERQDHPRRCQARRHDGQPCGRFAIVGGTVCTTHGGAAPQVRRKALMRQMLELDRKAQTEAAFNVMLPPELHPHFSGGGRGHRKAEPPKEPAPVPPNLVIDTPAVDRPAVAPPAREGPGKAPARPVEPVRGPFPTDGDDREMASASEPQLTTLEEAVIEMRRATRRRAAKRYM